MSDRSIVGGNHSNVCSGPPGFLCKSFSSAQATQLASEAAFYTSMHAEGLLSPYLSAVTGPAPPPGSDGGSGSGSGSGGGILLLSDATHGFDTGTRSLCDVKLGTRTWVETVSSKVEAVYTAKFADFGVVVDGGRSKRDYMRWRDSTTTSGSLGFRVTGMAVARRLEPASLGASSSTTADSERHPPDGNFRDVCNTNAPMSTRTA
jgi:hypothetical protein